MRMDPYGDPFEFVKWLPKQTPLLTGEFTPEQFTATKWHTAEEKAKYAVKLAKFIREGCPPEKFTKALYERLYHMFGFIAHTDHWGFRDARFGCRTNRLETLMLMICHPCWGSPDCVWSDVERAIIPYAEERLKKEVLEIRRAADAHERQAQDIVARVTDLATAQWAMLMLAEHFRGRPNDQLAKAACGILEKLATHPPAEGTAGEPAASKVTLLPAAINKTTVAQGMLF